ncbi:hypothetical protein BJ742DRAFT_299476 [Cladochytrium replicatum]|nr:hypothetical protein BJ742DRAFT_299476 [Cladochytrium replicatum]
MNTLLDSLGFGRNCRLPSEVRKRLEEEGVLVIVEGVPGTAVFKQPSTSDSYNPLRAAVGISAAGSFVIRTMGTVGAGGGLLLELHVSDIQDKLTTSLQHDLLAIDFDLVVGAKGKGTGPMSLRLTTSKAADIAAAVQKFGQSSGNSGMAASSSSTSGNPHSTDRSSVNIAEPNELQIKEDTAYPSAVHKDIIASRYAESESVNQFQNYSHHQTKTAVMEHPPPYELAYPAQQTPEPLTIPRVSPAVHARPNSGSTFPVWVRKELANDKLTFICENFPGTRIKEGYTCLSLHQYNMWSVEPISGAIGITQNRFVVMVYGDKFIDVHHDHPLRQFINVCFVQAGDLEVSFDAGKFRGDSKGVVRLQFNALSGATIVQQWAASGSDHDHLGSVDLTPYEAASVIPTSISKELDEDGLTLVCEDLRGWRIRQDYTNQRHHEYNLNSRETVRGSIGISCHRLVVMVQTDKFIDVPHRHPGRSEISVRQIDSEIVEFELDAGKFSSSGSAGLVKVGLHTRRAPDIVRELVKLSQQP